MDNIDKAIIYKEGNTLQKRVEDLNKEIKELNIKMGIKIAESVKSTNSAKLQFWLLNYGSWS